MISIIVPVYNGESYIERNFDSLMSQTNLNYEVIYVNDGSSDRTEQILQEITAKDARFSYYTIVNQGAAVARNFGVTHAKYDYVTFLDVDDFLNPDYILKSKIFLKEDNSDILVFGCQINNKINKLAITPNAYQRKQFLVELLTHGGWEIWGKVFKKSLFRSIQLPAEKILIGEDAYIFIQLVLNAQSIKVKQEFLYNYTVHSQSISHNKSQKTIEDGLYVAEFIAHKLTNIIDKKTIDTMILLFYSNSLRRGMLSSKHKYIPFIQSALRMETLLNLPFKKAVFITVFFMINKFKR